MPKAELSPRRTQRSQSLDGDWAARTCEPGEGESAGWQRDGFEPQLTATVPGHLQADLIREGLEPDFNFAENARLFRAREGKDWWLSREFEVESPSQRSELCFEGVDVDADAWLNGVHLGHHEDAHVSWAVDVTAALRAGMNRLVVRLDDGTRRAAGCEHERYAGLEEDLFEEHGPRMWVRKPQYVWRWDWAPRLLTCGIWRSVELRGHDAVALRDVSLRTRLGDDGTATVEASCEVECFEASCEVECFEASEGRVELRLSRGADSYLASAPLPPEAGLQRLPLTLEIADPELWWPAPHGEPALYECRAVVEVGSHSSRRDFRYGLRTIELEQRDLGVEGRSFTLLVNGRRIFCKGTNWQPPEHLYGCVEDEKVRRLIDLAAAANMNILRVNGCGTYESDRFYELCDERGILVWQDFPFTCSYYPDDDEGFCEQVRAEAEIAIRRLRNHASLAIWCGSNEIEWEHAWAQDPDNPIGVEPAPRLYGERIFRGLLPELCQRLDPDRPYISGTPWSDGDEFPNSNASGCRHVWDYQIVREPADRVHFGDIELDVSKFVSEFGYLGPSELASLERFLPADQLEPGSASWQFHDNVFEDGVTRAAIERHWSGAETIELADHLALGQLFQAEGMGTAIRHWRRRMFETSGAISWGYVDSWGTTTSWSLVDYYGRPRAAYFHAKRAFEPLHVSLRRDGDALAAWVVNDRPSTEEATLELGWVDLPASQLLATTLPVTAAANSAAVAAPLELPEAARWSPERFIPYARLRVGEEVVSRARATLVGFDYNRLRLPAPRVSAVRRGETIELEAESYVFGLHLSARGPETPSDNWFDMLPGEVRTIDFAQSPEGGEISAWSFADGRNHPGRFLVGEI
jgi:beta-mannosidase